MEAQGSLDLEVHGSQTTTGVTPNVERTRNRHHEKNVQLL